MNPIELNKDNFSATINSDKTVLVDLWAPWCGPCRMLSPIVDEVAEEAENLNLIVAKVNVDDNVEIAKNYGVSAIPTLLVFKNGELYKKSIGLVSKEEILELIK